ncbi:MAG: DUF6198 family protein [Blautia sp.]|nr:DUF6198 family protein [Blautia sp.]
MNTKKTDVRERLTRIVFCVLGLFIAGLGVAVTKKGELGVSPISSVANVLSLKFTFLTLGNWLIIWNCILILGQILILRRRFQLFQLLQIPLSFLFGYFTDFGVWLLSFTKIDAYYMRLLMVFLGTVILGLGISISVIANVILNSGEAFVKAIADTTHKEFGNLKVGFDITCMALAVTLSLLFFDFTVRGTREGTVIAALLTGFVVEFFTKRLRVPMERLITGSCK